MKINDTIKNLCVEILNLSMSISEEKESDVYVKYFPHVNEFDVEILQEGYVNNTQDVNSYEIDLTGSNAEQKLKEIKEILLDIGRN